LIGATGQPNLQLKAHLNLLTSVMGKMKSYNTVEEYFADQSSEVLNKLQQLRQCILEAAPHAEEKINYGIPCYALIENGKRDQQVMMAGYKNHISFYPFPTAIDAFKEELAPYTTGKGTVQFKIEEKLPLDLIKQIVIFRVKELNSTP